MEERLNLLDLRDYVGEKDQNEDAGKVNETAKYVLWQHSNVV